MRHPRSVVQVGEERAEPDLMVRMPLSNRGWADAPVPILVVEVLSASTRRRDLGTKRDFYRRAGVAEYWAVDREKRVVIQVRGESERRVSDSLRWSPPGTTASLEIDVVNMFAQLDT